MQDEATEPAQLHRTVKTSNGFHTSNATSSHFLGGQQQRSWMLPSQFPSSMEQNQSPNTLAKQARQVNRTTGDLDDSGRPEDTINSGRGHVNDQESPGAQLREANRAIEGALSSGHHTAAEQISMQVPPHKRPRLEAQVQMPLTAPWCPPLYSFVSTPVQTAYSPGVPAPATSPPVAATSSSSPRNVSGPGIYYHGQRPHPVSSANGSAYALPQKHTSAQPSISRRQSKPSSVSDSVGQTSANQTQSNVHNERWQQQTAQPRTTSSVSDGQTHTAQLPITMERTSTKVFLPRLKAVVTDPQVREAFKHWARPRVLLLEDACNCEDWFYLTLHQIYCWRTLNDAVGGQLGITGKRDVQLAKLQAILLPNTQLQYLATEWFSQFPTDQTELLMGAIPEVQNALKLMHMFLDKMSLNWSELSSSCLARKYPPSPYELHERLGISSTVLQTVFFTFILRQIEGGEDQDWIRCVSQFFKFTQSQLNYKFARIDQGLPEAPPNNDTGLAQFASEYFALRNKHATRPVLTRDATAVQALPPASTGQHPPPTQTMFPSRSQPMAINSSNQMPLTVACSPLKLGTSSGVTIGMATNAQRRPAPPSHTPLSSPRTSSMGPRQQDFVQQLTSIHAIRAAPVAAPGQRATDLSNSPAPSTGSHRRGNLSRTSNGMTKASSNHIASTQHIDSLSQKTTRLLPPAGKMMSLSTHPNPDRVGLHQARLLSPEPTVPELPYAGPRLFQVLQRFVLAPQLLTNQQSYYEWQINIPAVDISRRANDVLIKERIGRSAPKVRREFKRGSLVYRLRCIKLNSELNESAWSTAATYWPNTCFVSLNTDELELRRKSYWGKNLPCDLTRHIKAGMNTIELSVNLGPDERISTFAIAVEQIEVLDQEQCTKQLTLIDKSDSLAAIVASLAASQSDDEVAIVDAHISIDLIDPFTAQMWKISVRGKTCTHRECFDLQAFLESRPNKHRGVPLSSADDWKCPICNKDARPHRLVLDDFLLSVGKQLQANSKEGEEVRSIQVTPDGIWKPAKVEKQPQQRDADGQNGSLRATSARSTPSANPSKESVMREVRMEPPEIIVLDDG